MTTAELRYRRGPDGPRPADVRTGAQEGKMHDFDALYGGHYTSLTTQLFAYFGDRQEAQDVVQEAFCRALARWKQISTYDDPVAWVRRVAWNLATSNVRRLRVAATFRRRQQAEYAPPPNPDRVALFAALKTLPPRQRQATVMHYLADVPIGDIATAMDVSVGTVKSWLHRARTALATELTTDLTREENRHA